MTYPRLPTSRAPRTQIAGAAHKTPVATSRTIDARTGAAAVLQVREPAARRRLQVPRRLQRAVAPRRRPAPPRRRHLLLRQPRAGDRARRTAARHPARHRHAVGRAGGQAHRHAKATAAKSILYDRDTRRPRSDRQAPRRRARADADSALRSPAHHRRPGHGRARTDRGSRARSTCCSSPAAAADCSSGSAIAAQGDGAALPGDRRRAGRGRRCDAIVPDQDSCRRSTTRRRSPTARARRRSAR